ncbi:glycosyltransferase [Streptomyces sp. NPDC002078]
MATQSARPDRVLIVDSSTTDATRRVSEAFARRSGLDVEFVHSAPGLTLQRNVALDHLLEKTDVVHFVDDDVILEPDYLRWILAAFDEWPLAGGVGGKISNLPDHTARWYRRTFMLESRTQGALLRSGVNVLNFTGRHPRQADWLSGCSMSYRRSSITGLRFDESRAGNGVGEDVDFSARVGMRSQLVWTPLAVLEHRQSPINREDTALVTRRVIRHRWRLACDRVGRVSRTAVLFAITGEVFLSLFLAGMLRSRHYARHAAAHAAAVSDIVKGIPV